LQRLHFRRDSAISYSLVARVVETDIIAGHVLVDATSLMIRFIGMQVA
jgi:hypothetical protein